MLPAPVEASVYGVPSGGVTVIDSPDAVAWKRPPRLMIDASWVAIAASGSVAVRSVAWTP